MEQTNPDENFILEKPKIENEKIPIDNFKKSLMTATNKNSKSDIYLFLKENYSGEYSYPIFVKVFNQNVARSYGTNIVKKDYFSDFNNAYQITELKYKEIVNQEKKMESSSDGFLLPITTCPSRNLIIVRIYDAKKEDITKKFDSSGSYWVPDSIDISRLCADGKNIIDRATRLSDENIVHFITDKYDNSIKQMQNPINNAYDVLRNSRTFVPAKLDVITKNETRFVVLDLPGAFRAFEWFPGDHDTSEIYNFARAMSHTLENKIFTIKNNDTAAEIPPNMKIVEALKPKNRGSTQHRYSLRAEISGALPDNFDATED